jgi:hypothetical protein
MTNFRLTLLFALFFLIPPRVFSDARCPGEIAPVQYYPLPHSHIGVAATINGSGPYEFMVDTGAQITVIDPALAQALKLEAVGSLNVVTVASHVEAPLVSVTSIEIGPVSRQGIRMAVEDMGPLQAEFANLRGILGNNFLSRFDLLIDNSHHMLCFDDTGGLKQALRGEHVPTLSGTDPNSASSQAILVLAYLPDKGRQGSVLRLDSGANVPFLYVDHQSKASAWVQGNTIGRQARFLYAYTPERSVRFGRQKEMQIAFATPAINGRLYSKAGEDGILPTTLFHRVFISFASHFVIFDPN